MTSSSDYSDSDQEKKNALKSSTSSDDDAPAKKPKEKRVATRTPAIESGGSDSDRGSNKSSGSESDGESDDDKGPSSSRKRPSVPTKKTPVKRRRRNSDEGNGGNDRYRNLFDTQEDFHNWENMIEKEREQVLFDLMEKAELKKARDEITQALASKKKKNDDSDDDEDSGREKKKDRKRKDKRRVDADDGKPAARDGSDSDGDAEFHRPSEVDKKRKQKSAMADLLAKRKDKEKKDAKKAALSIDAVFGQESDSDSSSSDSSSNSSRSSSSSRDSSPARRQSDDERVLAAKRPVDCKEDLARVRLSRFRLAKWVHAPFFDKLVIGTYVRMQTGPIPNSKSKYRICKIMDVVRTPKVYSLEGTKTNKGVKLKWGKHERIYRLEYASNTDFPVEEFEEWKAVTMQEDVLPTLEQIGKKYKEIQKAGSHNFTSKEIDEMIKEKGMFTKTPRNFAMTKGDLMKKKEYAEQIGDLKEVQKLQREIEDLDSKADQLDKARSADISAIAWINQRNRNKMKEQFLGDNVQIEMSAQDDPFTRKKDRIKVGSGTKRGLSSTNVAQDPTGAAAADLKPLPISLLGAPIVHISKSSNNLFDLHKNIKKFDLDIDLGKLCTNRDGNQKKFDDDSTSGPSQPAASNDSRRLVSLDDYRRRKAESAMKDSKPLA